MLRVTAEVTMANGALRQIGEIQIYNLSDLAEVSDYKYVYWHEGVEKQIGTILKHRRSDGWVPLAERVLHALIIQ